MEGESLEGMAVSTGLRAWETRVRYGWEWHPHFHPDPYTLSAACLESFSTVLDTRGLDFLMCKIGMIIISNSGPCCED